MGASGLTESEVLARLSTRALGRSLTLVEEVGSTSDLARRLGLEGAAHGHLVLAESQSAGRGRRGRSWSSPPGRNLLLSLVLRPQLPPRRAPELTLLAAVAACEALRGLGAQAAIKWPNDLQIGGRKVAGILTEMSCRDSEVDFVVLGVGLNVNLAAEELPPELRDLATSLRIALGRELDRVEVLAALLASLERWLDRHAEAGFDVVRQRWSELSSTLGSRVRVHLERELLEGEAVAIDEDGALLLREASGQLSRVIAGDVEHLRPAP